MTEDKDFKRLVRRRMRKTGESYTTARSHLVAREGAALPAGYPELAGMSDEAVAAKTGRSWPTWVQVLDDIGGRDKSHREIAAWLNEHVDLGAWWSQAVTVGYERIRGLREIGQRSVGTYEATKSRTLALPISEVYEAFSTKRGRAGWLDDADIEVRAARRNGLVRLAWKDDTSVDDTSVEVTLTAKGERRTGVSIQHRKLPDRAAVEARKAFWADRLNALAARLRDGT